MFRYKLHDYWETPMWAASKLLNTTPPVEVTTNMSLWSMGNMAIQCESLSSGFVMSAAW
jgi:hypothetical protein